MIINKIGDNSKMLILFAFSIISWNVVQNNTFIFQKDNQKVTLEIENGLSYLKWDEKAKLTLKTENIDNKQIMMSAPGLKFVSRGNNTSDDVIMEITPDKKIIQNNVLDLLIMGRDLKNAIWTHKFKIMIK